MKEFKSFYKEVAGNEGNKCPYNKRLDTYGCGCQHDCSYCYAKSLLDFRNLWNAKEPSVADIKKIERKIAKLPQGTIIRLGGMTDCFQPLEEQMQVTRETIKLLNQYGIGYLIVTKSDLICEYMNTLDKDLAHIQISTTWIPCEKAVSTERRIKAIEKLYAEGFDVAVRLSPYVPQFVDFDRLNSIRCNKIIIEFLRVNHWIKKWLPLDYSDEKALDNLQIPYELIGYCEIDKYASKSYSAIHGVPESMNLGDITKIDEKALPKNIDLVTYGFPCYTVKQSGYEHLPLDKKIEYLAKVTGFDQVSVCEDVTEHYEYWKECVNWNKDDCCNLRKENK